jgi:hypothetical protein
MCESKTCQELPCPDKEMQEGVIESCNAFIHAICKSKKFGFKHANPEHKKRCNKCSKNYAQIGGGLCRCCFGGKQTVKEALKYVVFNLNAAC